ncbi:MAG: glycosyltransferase family 2 protein, partial [Bacteroidota bacterium]|nr:glycosyltransferase family 2 protein [Bacteroidota bacterium]MDX5431176.1 glycosyltransferase family 2 protein [Bacteroidota bacterium]MDX5469915.1 glycosyltransferase family 2 protein [Bacteroidota bacterium]
MEISVIIVNYNVEHFLEQALLSVRKALKQVEGEVWVVDNRSVDGSVDMVRKKFPEVHLIANDHNPGFAVANNQAIVQSKGRYVLLLNPDTVVEEDTFRKIVDFMDAHPDAGGLGVKMIDGKGEFLPESKRGLPTPQVAFYKMFGLSKLFPKSKIFGRYHLGFLSNDQVHEVDVLAGAFMLLRKETLDKIGLLDETFFMYGEDIDLSYRITQGGYKNYYFPDTTIIHYKGESTKKTSVNYVFVFYRAMVIFAKKHYSKRYASLFGIFINLAIWFRAGIALGYRFAQAAWQPVLDALILFGSSYLLKLYWEANHKFIRGGEYPPKYLYINVVIYILCWILGLYFSGAYRRHAPLRRLVFGMFSGTVAIAVLYAFAPDSLRFSRALIILGAVGGGLLLLIYRLMAYAARHKSLNYGEKKAYNTLVVGLPEEANRVQKLLRESGVPHTFHGFVAPGTSKPDSPDYVGALDQLKEIIEVFRITEVIFCAKDLSSSDIIYWMGALGESEVNFKIVPEETLYIIGSNTKNTNGEFYTIEMKLALASSSNHQNKRLFDLLSSLGMLALLPFLLITVKNKAG